MSFFSELTSELLQNTVEHKEDAKVEQGSALNEEKKRLYEKLQQNDMSRGVPIESDILYALPPLCQYDFRNEKFESELQKIEDLEVKRVVQAKIDVLLARLQKWELTVKDKKYQEWEFNLPGSVFLPEAGTDEQEQLKKLKSGFISLQSLPYEHSKVGKLEGKQLQQIRQTGSFEVASVLYPIPYTWKLSPWIVKGTEEIQKTYYKNLATSFQIIKTLKNDQQRVSQALRFSLTIAKRFASLLVGLRQMQHFDEIRVYEELYRSFYVKEFESLLAAGEASFFTFIDGSDALDNVAKEQINFQLNENRQKNQWIIQQLEEKFLEDKKPVLERLKQDFKELDDRAFELKEREILSEILKEIVNQSKYLPDNKKSHLLKLLQTAQCGVDINRETEQIMQNSLQKQQDILKQEHKIKSLSSLWMSEQLEEFSKSTLPVLKNHNYERIKSQLEERGLARSLITFENFNRFQTELPQQFKQTYPVLLAEQQLPMRKFVTTRHLFPPYDIKVTENKSAMTKRIVKTYSLVRTKDYETKTDANFWRLRLLVIRYFVWSINAAHLLFANALVGPLGIKALFSANPYFADQKIIANTGEIVGDFKITPYCHRLKLMLSGIQKSRQNFEDQPDTGFFGKNFARLFNYFECYVFRALIFVLVLLLLPVIHVSNCVLSLVSACTTWLWIPLTLLVRYLIINLIIFDFDSPYRNSSGNYYLRRRIISDWLPLFQLIFDLLFRVLLTTLFSILCIFILKPIAVALVATFAVIRRQLAYAADAVFFQCVKRLGRVPISDTKIAWKTGGIGIGRSYFLSMEEEDIVLMFYSELERFEFSEYEKRAHERIDKPLVKAQQLTKPLFELFGAGNMDFQEIKEIISTLKRQLQDQVQKKRLKYLPKVGSLVRQVRFTHDELAHLFPLILDLTFRFLEERVLVSSFYDYLKLDQKNTSRDTLIRTFWVKCFGTAQSIEPLEQLEQRITLKRDKQPNSSSLSHVLQGQVKLLRLRAETASVYRSDYKKQLAPLVTPQALANAIAAINFKTAAQEAPLRSLLVPAIPVLDHLRYLEKQKEQKELEKEIEEQNKDKKQQ